MCFTSPPYAQQRIYGGQVSDWLALMQGVFGNVPLAADGQLLVNLGLVYRDNEWVPYWEPWLAYMREQKWRCFGWYVWDRGAGMPGDYHGRLAPAFEFVFHFNRASRAARKTKQTVTRRVRVVSGLGRNPDDSKHASTSPGTIGQATKIPDSVIRVQQRSLRLGREVEGADHPAVFPVALAEEMLTIFCDEGALAYEPFAGSGSQIIAAERVNRSCYGVEINPAYCDVIIERWRRLTGTDAKKDRKR